MFLEACGVQCDLSVHGEIGEFHLKTRKKEPLSCWWCKEVGSMYGSVWNCSIILLQRRNFGWDGVKKGV